MPVSFRFEPTLILFCCGDGTIGIGGTADGPKFLKGLVFKVGLLFSCCGAAIFTDISRLFHVVRARAVDHHLHHVSFTKLIDKRLRRFCFFCKGSGKGGW